MHETTRTTEDFVVQTARLSREIEPPTDLWPGIEARIEKESSTLDALVRQLPQSVAPPRDLWPRVARRLVEARGEVSTGSARQRWVAVLACASVATTLALLIAVGARYVERAGVRSAWDSQARLAVPIAGSWALLGSALASNRDAGTDRAVPGVGRTLLREIELVRGERKAVERAMRTDSNDADLPLIWRHTYQVELDLTADAERVAIGYRRGYER